MDLTKYDYNQNVCPSCHSSNEVAVKTLVWEQATHSQGTRSFKTGGEALGELRVECGDCETCIWTSEAIPPAPVDVDNWERGTPCPNCSGTNIAETHIDWRYRTFDGELIVDGDRVATVEYRCDSCDSVLASAAHDIDTN